MQKQGKNTEKSEIVEKNNSQIIENQNNIQNNYNINTQLGKLDASHGIILLNNKIGFFDESLDQDFNISGEARNIQKLLINNEMFYVISINNDVPIFIKLHK